MTIGPRPWLPAGAVTSDRIEQALLATATIWSGRYLPAGSDIGFRAERRLTGDAEALSVKRDNVRLGVTGRGREALLSAVLAETNIGQDLPAGDELLLNRFAHRLLEDLAQQIAGALPATDSAAVMHFDLMVGGVAIGAASIPAEAVMLIVQKTFAALASPRSGQLVGRRSAIGSIEVDIVGQLGSAILTVGDLRGLAAGDVIVIDRLVSSGAELRVDGSGRPFASGEVATGDGANRLTLLSTAA